MSDSKTLKDVVREVGGLCGEFGTEPLQSGITEWEAVQNQTDEDARKFDQRWAEHALRVANNERLRKFYDKKGRTLLPPYRDWVRGTILVDVRDRMFKCTTKGTPEGSPERVFNRWAEGLAERWIECWFPPDLADDKRPELLWPIPLRREMKFPEACAILAALHYQYSVGIAEVVGPDASFLPGLCSGDPGWRGFGPYYHLIDNVEKLGDRLETDVPDLMAMTEDVREELAKRSGGQQAAVMVAPGSDGKNSRSLVEPCPDAFTCYRVSIASGMKQVELAELLTKELKRKVSHGQVSRWNKRVKEWVEAGNVLPPLPQASRGTATAIDPQTLDLGARRDGHTPRQRAKQSVDSDD